MSKPLIAWDSAGAPTIVRAEMNALRQSLDAAIPPKRDVNRNLLVGTWNIKSFSSLSEKWLAEDNDSPKRDWRALWAITEIISRFDVIAVQEIMGDLLALRTMIKTLGKDWAFLITDVSRGDAGHNERMGFIFDKRRVELSGLAGELVIPHDWETVIPSGALQRQFARTPYAVSFRAGKETFILVTLHIEYGGSSAGRIPELTGIAEWMNDWARQTNSYGQNFMVLGDFNIDRYDDDLWNAFTSTGLTVPQQLNAVRRSIFADANDPMREKFYDQIAWFTSGGRRQLNMEFLGGGGFDFVPLLYTDLNMPRSSMQYRMSDHYPLWTEFRCQD
ncbi:endonuclease/exonuclease/phosphatase family protein [Hyphococcus sp.]|uniref:endonuclease/exonuclease/phosphatase family protein n=1 Tax=Hyphococcus sp. TaxID=2038636 RepID=UPI00207EF49A|nr:MAG: hypothetical protein DHS20C04_02870 [Marinicaulis sp.]